MDNVVRYLEEFKPVSSSWFQNETTALKYYEFFREFIKRENLEKAEWPDFQKIGKHLNCFQSMALARGNALGRPNHRIERYRSSFIYLAYGPDPLKERIRKFYTDEARKLDFFGKAAVSEIVGFLYSDEFFLFNSRDEFAVKFLGIETQFESGDDFVDRLVKFNLAVEPVRREYLRIIGRQTNLPLNLEVDQFFSWLYETHSKDKTEEDGKRVARHWIMGAGEGASLWDEFLQKGIITIGWDRLGNLAEYKSSYEVRDALGRHYPQDAKQTNNAKSCFDFAFKMRPGDGVFVKEGTKTIRGYGVIESDYQFDDSRSSHKHVRKVRWIKSGDFKLPENLTLSVKTLTRISERDLLESLDHLVNAPALIQVPVSDSNSEGIKHWWLNANPKIWDFAATSIGGRQVYTTHNERGNKRQKYKYFHEVKPGDLVVGYVTSPDREIVAICQITKGVHPGPHGEGIEFEKIEQLTNPLPLEELQKNPDLKQCEPLINNQGSLFRLTPEEFALIRSLIDDLNVQVGPKALPFTKKEALQSLFLSESGFEQMLTALRERKNVILQGPPGVGKTFVAKRLCFALMGAEDPSRVQMIQFHQSYSYEDFIQGFRPTDKGNFALKNGVFFQFCRKAQRDPENAPHVFIIDEINRGNLSKILGEVMMLIEPDKRGRAHAIPLAYSQSTDDVFFVPNNVYLIGTMNTADRSLALVDYALRRRFRFLTLEPEFESPAFRRHLKQSGASDALIQKIIDRMTALNKEISVDQKNLGRGYQVGHSFFCPIDNVPLADDWYRRVIETEIRPLLEEYWLDDTEKVENLTSALLA